MAPHQPSGPAVLASYQPSVLCSKPWCQVTNPAFELTIGTGGFSPAFTGLPVVSATVPMTTAASSVARVVFGNRFEISFMIMV
ncbi:MAG: hypothetical protein P8Y54_14440 [Xanthomonadales bacterium]